MTSLAAGPEPNSLLTTNDTAAIGAALHRLNMTETDPGFEKEVVKPRWALRWVRETLRAPLELPAVAGRIRAAATGEAADVWRLSADLLEAAPAPVGPASADVVFTASNALNPHLAGYIAEFVDQAAAARQALDNALAGVTPTRRSYAAASILSGLVTLEDHPEAIPCLKAAGVASGDVARVLGEALDLDPAPAASNLLEAVLGVDIGELLRGGRVLHAAARRLTAQAQTVTEWPDRPLTFETALGRVVVGTKGPDRYESAALLTIDPGGDDDYTGEAGVANGLAADDTEVVPPGERRLTGGYSGGSGSVPTETREAIVKIAAPLAAIIDLGGDDRYNGTGLFGAGSALFGLAVLIDAAGNDTYRAAYAGQGAAVGGAAWVEDRAGDDTYRGGVFCQGAAVAGLGALDDEAGHDVYEVGLAGQAYSGIRGAGWLIDRAGDDRYLAGNREPDWDRHPDRFLSLAQGFSIGLRPFSGGGIAALVDLAGNDTYVADVYGQGVSYWYSAGFLLDAAGNDTYRMFHYGQGSGIHLSLGLLADDAGDDSYTGSILAQGNAHDYAVGMLIDRGGNDTYTADTYSQGRALYNAFALLLDGGGNDAYFASQTNECQGLGHNGAQREYGGLALLIDEAGADRYSCGAANGTATLRPWYGIVMDIDPSLSAGRQAGAGLRAASHASEAAELRGPADPNVGGALRRGDGRREDPGTNKVAAAERASHIVAAAERASHIVASHIEPEKAPVYETGHLQWPVLSIEQILVLAQHPGNGPVDRAIRRDAGRELLWRGPAALEGLMRYAHLENNTIQLRTQEQVDSLSGEAAAPILARFLGDSHPRTRRLAAYYLGMHGRPGKAGRARASGPAEMEGGRLKVGGRGSEGEGRGLKVEGRGSEGEGRGLKVEGGDPQEGRAGASSPRRGGVGEEARQGCRRPTPEGPVAVAAVARLRALLDDEEAAGAAIRTLGKWRDRESVARIGEFLASVKEPRRVAAANALRDMGDPAAVPVLLAALRDPVFTVRQTAQRALIALGGPAEKAALKAWPTADPATRRHLLTVLAAGDSWAARRLVNAARHDPDEGVRADAEMLLREKGP